MTDYRGLPAVHSLLGRRPLEEAVSVHGRDLVVDAAREALDAARRAIRAGGPAPSEEALIGDALSLLSAWQIPRPRRVVNATGIIVHTNLGRAPVSGEAARAMAEAAGAYTDLELDLHTGERGSRHDLLDALLRRLTGAEATLVVNNNAGATLLMLAALAKGRGVLVARGQLVEIGGGFRIPDVMQAGGAKLVEVGTTNRTYLEDYRAAVDETTALLLRVHTSNYQVVGFTHEVALEDLVGLGRELDLPVVDDLGSGSLIDTRQFGLAFEPTIPDSIAKGAALATSSGDKLLGGPQAGIIVGRQDLITTLRRHPLARALRPGKDVIAGLHATLLHYARGEVLEKVPVWRMIATSAEEVGERAAAWQQALSASEGQVTLLAGRSAVGGGSLPGETLPTTLLAVATERPDALAAALRAADPPVVGRIAEGAVVLDPRTVLPGEDELVVRALAGALARLD